MTYLFKNKYRIDSARLKNWDYASEGKYFITICTKNREHYFGECLDGKMVLSTIGAIVQGFWYEIPKHFPNVSLGEFVVMPNHIHGILILSFSSKVEVPPNSNPTSNSASNDSKIQPHSSEFYQRISPKPRSVSTIVRSYKSICTRHIRGAFPCKDFGWQERFWDSLIRDDDSLSHISRYIVNNPLSWKDDRFFEG